MATEWPWWLFSGALTLSAALAGNGALWVTGASAHRLLPTGSNLSRRHVSLRKTEVYKRHLRCLF
jgi:hypothetical protein